MTRLVWRGLTRKAEFLLAEPLYQLSVALEARLITGLHGVRPEAERLEQARALQISSIGSTVAALN